MDISITLGAPQTIMLVCYILNLAIAIRYHNETKAIKYNAWITLISAIIAILILNWGGFF